MRLTPKDVKDDVGDQPPPHVGQRQTGQSHFIRTVMSGIEELHEEPT